MRMHSLVPQLWGRSEEEPDVFRNLHREIDRVFEDFGRSFPFPGFMGEGGYFTPRVNVSETDKEIQISAELPGMEEKDIDVNLSGNVLTIKGEKKYEKEEEKKDYRIMERSYGSFQRRIPLPYDIAADNIKAEFSKGVLTITLPKPPEVAEKNKKIKIESKS